MVFWVILIAFLIGVGLMLLDYDYGPNIFGFILAFSCGMCLAGFLGIISNEYIGLDAKVQQMEETYNALTYKVESGACRDDFGLLNKEVIDEIQAWNEDIIYHQNIQRDFWIGIFYANIYDQFETIDYKQIFQARKPMVSTVG